MPAETDVQHRGFLHRIFTPPVIHGDLEATRLSRLLYPILIAGIVVDLITAPLLVLFSRIETTNHILNFVFLGILLILTLLVRKGFVRIAAISLLFLFWLYVVNVLVLLGGIHHPVASSLLLLVLLAWVLLGPRPALVAVAVSLLTVTGILALDVLGILPPTTRPESRFQIYIVFLANFTIVAVIGYLYQTSLHEALHKAEVELAERRRAEQDRLKFELGIERSHDAIFMTDTDGIILYVNPAFERIYGYAADEAVGQTPEILSADTQDRSAHERHWKTLLANRTVTDEIVNRTKDGRLLTIEESLNPITIDRGEITGFLAIQRDVSLRKSAEEALRASERRYLTLFHSAGDAIFLIRDDCFVECNKRAEEMFRGTRDQLVGIPPYDVSPPLQEDGTGSREKALAMIAVAADGKPHTFSWRHRRLDGDEFDAEVTLTLVELETGRHVQAIVRDVTEQKAVQKELIRSEARFRSLVQNLDDMITVHDERATITFISPSITRFLGYDPDAMIGKSALEFVHPEDRERVEHDFQEVARGENPGTPTKYRVRHRDGHYVVLESIGSRPKEQSGIGGIIITSRDITRRQEAEEQIKASLREKEVLLKEIHHRVKNNMQVISSLLSLQAQTAGSRTIDDILQDSQQRVRSMALVHETLYRTDNLASIDFQEYLQSLVALLRRSYTAGNVRLELEADPVRISIEHAVPCGLIANELVSNAFKHAFPNGREGTILVRLRAVSPTRAQLVVSDNGVGLPPGLDALTSRSLGLQLVSMLTEQLDATFAYQAAGGSEFTVEFSLSPPVSS